MNDTCPLCLKSESKRFAIFQKKNYFQCDLCSLTFLSPTQRLSHKEEKKRYDLHENSPKDIGYRKFLDQLVTPLENFIEKSGCGLDFGCGPGPTLSVMLEERGYHCKNYDPIYFPINQRLENKYDFISCSEVFEHMYDPKKELSLLTSLLKPQGYLAIMTSMLNDNEDFPNWHYIREDTHVCFYKTETFKWIEKAYPLALVYHQKNVTIYRYET